MGAGAGTTLNFSWDTTGATIATHTLTATAATVSGELDTSNNAASTTADVISAGAVNDLAVIAMSTNPSSPIGTCGTRLNGIQVIVTVENQGTVAESNFFVTLGSNVAGDPNFPDKQVISLASGATADQTFTWNYGQNDACGLRTLTATVTTVTGETDTADNTQTLDVTIN